MSTTAARQIGAGTAGGSLPSGWHLVRLSDVCELNPRRPDLSGRADDAPTTFVPMEAVDEQQAAVTAAKIRPYREVAKGYTYFAEGDVLFAKITPCMQNGKHAIARGLTDGIGFGSTEFHVIRPGQNITAEWVWYFVRQPSVLTDATRTFTGAVGQQRVPDDFLARLRIPLPPLTEQRRILAVLSEKLSAIEKARAAAEERHRSAKAIPRASLKSIFQSSEALNWPLQRLDRMCHIVMGQSPKGETCNKDGVGVPLLNGPTEFGKDHPTPVQWTSIPTRFAETGDILYCVRGATTGRMNTADRRYCVGRGLAAFRGRDGLVTTAFLRCLIEYATTALLGRTAGSTFPNLPGSEIASFEAHFPPIGEQERLVSILAQWRLKSEAIIHSSEAELAAMNSLGCSLLRRAFAGGL